MTDQQTISNAAESDEYRAEKKLRFPEWTTRENAQLKHRRNGTSNIPGGRLLSLLVVIIIAFILHGCSPRMVTPLTLAAELGDVKQVQQLLRDGANVNEREPRKRNRPPLIAAVDNGHLEVVEILLKHGADPNLRCMHGETALMHAVMPGDENIKMVELLLQFGADPTVVHDPPHPQSAIDWARGAHNSERIQKLFAQWLETGKGVNSINAPNKLGETGVVIGVTSTNRKSP